MWETIAIIAASGAAVGLLKACKDYSKRCSEGEKFSIKKFGLTVLEGIIGGVISSAPSIGVTAGTKAAGKLTDRANILKKIKNG